MTGDLVRILVNNKHSPLIPPINSIFYSLFISNRENSIENLNILLLPLVNCIEREEFKEEDEIPGI